jgi:superfamily II DNA or RNA helicase
MNQTFQGWAAVADSLRQEADRQSRLAREKGEAAAHLNEGQCASLRAIASRITSNGVVIADEVGMGKTRIAVEVARCVIKAGGRVAILIPSGLGYQWREELQNGGIPDVPPVLRSLKSYLAPWDMGQSTNQSPWFKGEAVMVSHGFTNWRLGERAEPWRFVLLPELYARWREIVYGRLPNFYHDHPLLADERTRNAAVSITATVPRKAHHPIQRGLTELLKFSWPKPLVDADEYSRDGDLRVWLEKGVGWGLGVFDLVIIDEAHKARAAESGLSRLLKNVIVSSNDARRIALTATPVELDVGQWSETLGRLNLDSSVLGEIQDVSDQYADAVKRLRQVWRSSEEAREAYNVAATRFQNMLTPYLLRRDKREDPEVKQFQAYSNLRINEYRQEREITVETSQLSMAWRNAICAAESLSVVSRQKDDPVAKRLRLTLGNGHGIAALLDQTRRHERDDRKQDEHDGTIPEYNQGKTDSSEGQDERKRRDRAKWWLNTINQAFSAGNDSLYHHPAILAAVAAIEEVTGQGEKVLVFGRFTRPLRALVDLLNAREMLRRVQTGEPWPQAKVHGESDGTAEDSDWVAVHAAHGQLKSSVDLATLNKTLDTRYNRESYRRERFRERLISQIEEGWKETGPGTRIRAIFNHFKRSVDAMDVEDREKQRSLALVARAIIELLGNPDSEVSPVDLADAFRDLVLAMSDRDDADNDSEMDKDEAAELWETIEGRLHEEYNRPQGGFARLMFGETSPESRRVIQLAFNRAKSFPKVLVAQSLVGREGLNLHKSCRVVVLLHPEWNPGVVEQQIGRVDRVDSYWCQQLRKAIASNTPVALLPRIEVRPVIFRDTYDEHNWGVLRTRWDDLRAQLHGIVIPPSAPIDCDDEESRKLVDEISKAAPNFSPIGN